jgi:prefoldin subunit 5
MVRAHRVAMERLDRMERAMRERDAAMGKVAREMNARIDRLEAVAKKPAPPHGGDKNKEKPVADERLRKAAGELEARMKRVGEVEKKLGEREGELKKAAEMLEKREKELREMGEKLKAAAKGLEAREKRLREMEQGLRKKKERKAGGE